MILDLAESPIPFDELLDRNAQANPDRPAIAMAESDYVLTLADYAQRAGDAARYLAERGIGPGDRVAIWGQNSYAWAIWLAGAAWRGASAVALHPGLPREDLARSLAHARPSWLICDTVQRGRSLAELAQEAAESPALRAAGLRGLTVMKGGDGDVSYEDILERGAAPAHLGKLGEPLNLQFTSGSTGRPKLVVLSHRSLVVNSAITADRSNVTDRDALASPLPLCHSGGLSSGLVMGIATGAHLALDRLSGLVLAFPGEGDFLDFAGSSGCHHSSKLTHVSAVLRPWLTRKSNKAKNYADLNPGLIHR